MLGSGSQKSGLLESDAIEARKRFRVIFPHEVLAVEALMALLFKG
jgi:hypothetical protein